MISIIGLGFVGGAMHKSFQQKKVDVVGYDKFKDGGIGLFEDVISSSISFLCLPTLFHAETNQYNKDAIYETCDKLKDNNYSGLVVIKSTVEPETTDNLSKAYPMLKICHNPEFLTAKTAFDDFHNQKHIVLGKGENCLDSDIGGLVTFYKTHYPDAIVSTCSSLESESMKIMCNSFYASKIMIFNEYYQLCQKNGADFNMIRNLMLKNNWINPMHTNVPGTDKQLGYGGDCFPKDTTALCSYMETMHSDNTVLKGVIEERNKLRDD